MDYRQKIKSKDELVREVAAARRAGKRIVHCHGCFDILHPGHVRHLAWARQQGDAFVVTVSADPVVGKGVGRPFVPAALRAENLAALGFVDLVAIDDGAWAGPILGVLKPDVYVKGKEFENDFSGRFGRERELVGSYGGKVLFSSGDVVYSSTSIYENERARLGLPDERLRAFRSRNGISYEQLVDVLRRPPAAPVLVVGDLLLVEEIQCLPSGHGTGGVTPCFKPTGAECRLHGAAGVARSLARLGADVRLVTLVGNDGDGKWVGETLERESFPVELIVDPTRPTPRERRYVARDREVLILRDYESHPLEPRLQERLLGAVQLHVEGVRAVAVTDYRAGAAGPGTLSELRVLSRMHEAPVLGITAPLAGLTNVLALSGFTMASVGEMGLRQTFSDMESGVADVAALAVHRAALRRLVVCLPDGGLLLLSPRTGVPRPEALSRYELRMNTFTDYLPHFGPEPGGGTDGEELLPGLVFSIAAGLPFMAAAYVAVAAASARGCFDAPDADGTGADLRERLAAYLVDYSFMPDERAAVSGERDAPVTFRR